MSQIEETMFEIWRKKGEVIFSELAEEDWHTFDRLKELFVEYDRLEKLEKKISYLAIEQQDEIRKQMTALLSIGEEK